MRFAFAVVVVAACSSSSEPNGFETLADNNRSYAPAETDLQRFIPCGVEDPAYADSNLFSLTMYGSPVDNFPSTINVSFHRTLALLQPLTVDLGDPFISATLTDGTQLFGQNGTLPLQGNTFAWAQGGDPDELDANLLDNVLVQIDHVPSMDGEDATLTIRMQFTDGGVLDAKVSAQPTTSYAGCPL